MSNPTTKKPLVVVITGPTASGKSGYALERASRENGVIINADSIQLYQGFPILAAQPSHQDRTTCPHMLYEVLPLLSPIASVGSWYARAKQAIDEVLSQGKTPFIVGGTGFYLKALLEGLPSLPSFSENERQAFETASSNVPTPTLYRELAEVDPDLASPLSPHDRQRIVRALEVWHITGRPLSAWQKDPPQHLPYTFDVTLLWPEHAILLDRIARRFDLMLEKGVAEEVATLRPHLPTGLTPREVARRLPVTRACGFWDILAGLEGQITSAEVRKRVIIATRRYAKRQRTWFRHQLKPDRTLSL